MQFIWFHATIIIRYEQLQLQVNILNASKLQLFQSNHLEYLYLTNRWNPNRYYHFISDWTW